MEISEKTELFKKNHMVFHCAKVILEKKLKIQIFKKFFRFYRILKGQIVLKPRKMEISEKTELF